MALRQIVSEYVSAELRRQVRSRAGARCEYCRIHEESSIGRVTISLLKLNRPELLEIRKQLARPGRRPR